jgi:hypothetical protein
MKEEATVGWPLEEDIIEDHKVPHLEAKQKEVKGRAA